MTASQDAYDRLVADLSEELARWVGDDATMLLRNELRRILRESQEAVEAGAQADA